MNIVFAPQAWEDYCYWQKHDRRLLKRINTLVDDVCRNPDSAEGIGKPEILKYGAEGAMSRRVNDEHRLVYRVRGHNVEILQARLHYR
jgi:toxin YoeB